MLSKVLPSNNVAMSDDPDEQKQIHTNGWHKTKKSYVLTEGEILLNHTEQIRSDAKYGLLWLLNVLKCT